MFDYFNPRPREEGDTADITMCGIMAISIHALVKRATLHFDVSDGAVFISIHALVKRATNLIDKYSIYFDISIHALVKRATAGITKC